jgi:hypothetical protein
MWKESIVSDSRTRKGPASKTVAEFGDFQTPPTLAKQACALLARQGLVPASILEPNCGKGAFLAAASEAFSGAHALVGVEINELYADLARRSIESTRSASRDVRVIQGDFFKVDWRELLGALPDPLLIIGNPPWVTNAELSALGSSNLPKKSNFQGHRGLDAITGKSNFDISEYMLIQEIGWISQRDATLAMLCKTAVARKALRYAWQHSTAPQKSDMYLIDAGECFGASVDAAFLVITTGRRTEEVPMCAVYDSLEAQSPQTEFGYRHGHVVSDVRRYDRWKHLEGRERYKWRSGIKHDCAKVMELRKENGVYRNAMGEHVSIEPDCLYPMLKSSDLAKSGYPIPSRWMLVTQHHPGEQTHEIRTLAPATWQYLLKHAQILSSRASSIYRNRPRFSVFGVGDYSFSDWKVAISGFYKKLDFKVIGPHEGKPVVLDDTCYFIACRCREEAILLADLLNSRPAKEFYTSMIFWDEKRPITLSLLRRLDLLAVAKELGLDDSLHGFPPASEESSPEPLLFT